MHTISEAAALRQLIGRWRRSGERIAFVPTMGNLHQGHLQLIERAKELADRCVASIFVNPMQFGVGEDYSSYPRTMQEDRAKLEECGVDLLFAPEVATIYPDGDQEQTRVEVPELSDILCGASRPGHFVGVATVVCKLFNLVQPDLALFGEKDYQQLAVIRRMTRDLALAVEIVGVATVREVDGLAMSSRNGYLNQQERELAPQLYALLQQTAEAIRHGRMDYTELEQEAMEQLASTGMRPDYYAIRRQADLQQPGAGDASLVILAAAYLGTARLIDNLQIDIAEVAVQT